MGERPLWLATALVLSLALVVGGAAGRGLRAEALVQLASVALLGLATIALFSRPASRPARRALIVAAIAVVSVIGQLVPLPPALWTRLAGRGFVVTAFELNDMALVWMPISLDPGATWRSALALLPPLAVFCAVMRIGYDGRRRLCLMLIGLALVSFVVGLVQLMQGPDSAWRFHAITNRHDSVGFFANRNHHAGLLYAALPFAAAWIAGAGSWRRRGRRESDPRGGRKGGVGDAPGNASRGAPGGALGALGGGLAVAALLLGLGLTLSRAGVLLGLAAVVLSALMLKPAGARRGGGTCVVALAAAAGLALIVHYALPGLLARLHSLAMDGQRVDILTRTLAGAREFWPVGAGFGTFQQVYVMYERPETLLLHYVNHAHNDWVELWLEGGWAFALAAAAFLSWFTVAAWQAWAGRRWTEREPGAEAGAPDRALARAASISAALLLLHSLVDYPLRTAGLACVFAMCCALLVPPDRGAVSAHLRKLDANPGSPVFAMCCALLVPPDRGAVSAHLRKLDANPGSPKET